jgi:hypothetical protein
MHEMVKRPGKPNDRMQAWIDARKRHGLSHAEVQMARELGMNPKKLGKLDHHHQEPWKMPLREFIRRLYFKRFGKENPDIIQTLEEKVRRDAEKKAIRRQAKLLGLQSDAANAKESYSTAHSSTQASPLHNVEPKTGKS